MPSIRPSALRRLPALLALAATAAIAPSAHAVDAYVATGFPYLLVGVAQPVTETITLRADWGTIGHHSYSGSTSDNDYQGSLTYDRFGGFADWFVAGSFRLTGGVTLNHGSTTMRATSHGNQITIGGTTYNYVGDVTSTITLPQASPYLGIGWGHQPAAEKGFAFHADLGVAFGKPKATPLKAEGDVAAHVSDADLADENQRFQSGVGDIKGIPQLTIGASYRF